MTATQPAVDNLADLARRDPVVARLATLQGIAFCACDDPGWREGVPAHGEVPTSPDVPILHGQTVLLDPACAGRLLARLATAAGEAGVADAERLARSARAGACDPLHLIEDGLTQDAEALGRTAAGLGVEPRLLGLLAHLLALPLLHACRAEAAGWPDGGSWDAGYCPVCAAWPLLAESRGLARERWLRCGGCGSGWRLAHHRCAFCGNADHRGRSYFAAEQEREVRWAEVCDRCRGYLKTVASLAELAPAELAAQDLATLELDLAALQAGYARPTEPGFRLQVRVEPLLRATGAAWVRLPWRRA
jgi:FdhE protein